ncbi:MAG: hypothetical protein E6Q33_02425 [Neisseriales bacterium]|nr:MAG: hypothetical protein E6Q33_02425 [Neisseriales bacterium]
MIFTMSQSEFAKRVKVKQVYISKLIKQGKLPTKGNKLVMPNAEKVFYQNKSRMKLTDSTIVEVFNSAESEDQPIKNNQNADMQDLLNVKVRKETILADNHEINLKKALGKLVSIEEVNKTVTHGLIIVRNAFISLPNRFAQRLEGLSAAEIQLMLEDEVNEVLTELYNLQETYQDESGNTE